MLTPGMILSSFLGAAGEVGAAEAAGGGRLVGRLGSMGVNAAAGLGLAQITALASAELAEVTGVGSVGHRRLQQYNQNKNIANAIPGPDELIRRFNQLPWENGQPTLAHRTWLENSLANHGINLSVSAWRSLIDWSHQFAAPALYLRAFYRGTLYEDETKIVSQDGGRRDLDDMIRRIEMQSKIDRELLLAPPFAWNALDSAKLVESGRIADAEYDGMLKAAGIVRRDDRLKFHALVNAQEVPQVVALWLRDEIDRPEALRRLALAGVVGDLPREAVLKFAMRIGDPAFLARAASRRAWDDDLAVKYGLDDGLADSPAAIWWAKAQGMIGEAGKLPEANGGPADWQKLEWRAGRPLPDFGLAAIMQHRLRPLPDEPGQSVVDGTAPWTRGNTLDMLRVAGYSEPIIDRLIGLVYEPLNIRLINHVLSPLATHPEVAKVALENLGHPTDWIESAMLDHGFAPPLAKVAAAGILAQADDRANAERIEHEKRLRQETRNMWLKQYRLGTISRDIAANNITDQFFFGPMVESELAIIDAEFKDAIVSAQLRTLHESWLTGKLGADTITATLTQIGLTDERKQQYLTEWTWERTEKTRMLSTQEVLAQLKAGLMSLPIAQARLVNLGWSAPDAILETALIEQELAVAQARTAHETASKAAAENRRAQAAAHREEKLHEQEQAKARQEAEKTAWDVALAGPRQLAASAEYAAKVHKAQVAYAAAEKSGKSEAEQAALASAVAGYEKYLIAQIKLRQQGVEVQHEVGPVDAPMAPASQPGTQLFVPAQPAVSQPTGDGSGGAGAAPS